MGNKTIFRGNIIGQVHTGSGNIAVYNGNISEKLDFLLNNFFDEHHKEIVFPFVKHLSEDKVSNIINIYQSMNELELDKLDSITRELKDVIQKLNCTFPGKDHINEIFDNKVGAINQLKLSVPIIPLLLSYEGTIQLDCIAKIKSIWNILLSKVRRNDDE